MKMKLTKRDQKLLMVLAGILIFFLAYMLVITPLNDKTDLLEQQITSLKPRLTMLEHHAENLPTYEVGIEQYRTEIEESLAKLPSDVKDEDMLAYMIELRDEVEFDFTGAQINTPSLLSDFEGTRSEASSDAADHFQIYSVNGNLTAEMNYPQLKQILNSMYDNEEQTALDTLAVSYNSQTGKLTTNIGILKFYVNYSGAEYQPKDLPEVNWGVKDLFGTTSGAAESAAEPAASEDSESEAAAE